MALIDDTPRIKAALSALPGLRTVTEGWPKAEAKRPCAMVSTASAIPARYYDGIRYATTLVYYIRLWTVSADEARSLAGDIDDAMTALGYRLENAYDAHDDIGRRKVLHYSQTF